MSERDEQPTADPVTTGPHGLAEEQAALRRVAELVARGADRQAVLEAVTAEAFSLFPVDFTALLEYEDDGAARIVAVHHGPPGLAIGERAPRIPDGLVLRVLRSHAPTRVDAYAQLQGPGLARMRELGISAGAAAPILVDGRLWGVLTAMTRTGTVAPDLEHVLADFAELAAIAVASAQAKDDLRALVDEQSALRRIAELAVKGAVVQEVLRAVTVEASALVDGAVMTLAEFDSTGSTTVRASSVDQSEVGRHVDETLAQQLRRTGAPARLRAALAVPISVDGEIWGLLAATSPAAALPPETERRLSQFADLAAAAISSAVARAELRRIADEQAALREVAELAARDAPAEEVLDVVARQASRLAHVDFTTILRYEPDGSVEIVALSGAPAHLAVGMRDPNSGDGVTQRVWRDRRSARLERLTSVSSEWSEVASGLGYTTSVAVPVLIRGALWGTLVVVGRGEPLSAGIEDSLTSFASLAGTAISNAQARRELLALADEQAAFRRVSDLVAHGTALDEIFRAVAVEASRLLGGLPASLQRLELDEVVTTVAADGVDAAPVDEGAEVAVPVLVDGRAWGRLTASVDRRNPPTRTEERLRQFADLVAVAITNHENRAQLMASRARVVATADETRRRLQRDVHDGAQQRLVQTIITLKLARDTVPAGSAVGERIVEALYHAERANAELRDLVRGILPASFTHGGLRSGLASLVSDVSVPVRLQVSAPPLPQQIETTAYFIVAEALTNVVKHASASHAVVRVDVEGSRLLVDVRDDGVGGADAATGGGLTGLSDRVAAAGGTLTVHSPVGGGTDLRASLPLPEEPS